MKKTKEILLNQTECNSVVACNWCKQIKISFHGTDIAMSCPTFSKLNQLIAQNDISDFIMELIYDKTLFAECNLRTLLLASTDTELESLKTLVLQAKLMQDVYNTLGY